MSAFCKLQSSMQILDFDGNGSEVGGICPDSESKTR